MDIKGQINRLKEQLAKLNKRTKQIIAAGLALVIIVSVVIAVVINSQPYETLFADLTTSEANEIMGKLDDLGVGYRYENNGTILVPSSQEPSVKAQLVSEGYPKSGLTYSVFSENIGMTTTDFERQSYLIFDLQDRIAGTIRYFDGVQDAIVTIAPATEKKYVLQQDAVEARASVTVIMQNGGSPGADVVDGIVRLVVNSVPGGIEEANVTVLDGNGRALNSSTGSSGTYGMANLKLSLEKEINASLNEELLYMLTPLFGEGKIRVSVNSTVDVDKKVREIIEYLPSEENRGVVSHETHMAEVNRAGDDAGGVVGVDANGEVPVYGGYASDGSEIYFQTQDDIDYVVSQIKEQVQSEAGAITDMMVSVAFDSTTLTDARQREIRTLIARVVGIEDEDMDTNIALYFDTFVVEEEPPAQAAEGGFFSQPYVLIGLIVVGILLVAAIVVIMLLRRRKQKKEDEEQEEARVEAGYPPENYIMDIQLPEIQTTKEQELKSKIIDFADENPEISAQLIKTWLKGVDAQ